MMLLWLSLLIISCNAIHDVIFLIPFEISFSETNQFAFTINYLQNFITSSSRFFNDNITIAFIKDISSTDYIDIGFSISATTFEEESNIKNKDVQLYRSHLMTANNLPPIIGIELKYKPCTNGKYSTFYHYDVECQWLCDHLSIYNNQTHSCQSISNVSSIIQITETNTHRFIFIGYISSLLTTIIFAILFALKPYVSNICTKKVNKKSTKPGLKKKKSVYFYNDTENDKESDKESVEMQEVKTDDKSIHHGPNTTQAQEPEIEPFPEDTNNENNITMIITSDDNQCTKDNATISDPTAYRGPAYIKKLYASQPNILLDTHSM